MPHLQLARPMAFIAVAFLLLNLQVGVEAFPSGAPAAACSTLTPEHGVGALDCGASCPYRLNLQNGGLQYSCGEINMLTLNTSNSNMPFRGFFIQARVESPGLLTFDATANDFSGTGTGFLPINANYQTRECFGVDNGATHTNGNDKTSVDFSWVGPAASNSPVRIVLWMSVVQVLQTFFVQIPALDLIPGPDCFLDPTPTTPEEVTTMTTTEEITTMTTTEEVTTMTTTEEVTTMTTTEEVTLATMTTAPPDPELSVSVEMSRYSSIEGESLEICLVVLEGTASADITIRHHRSYLFGLIREYEEVIIPSGSTVSDSICFDTPVVDNDVVDNGNVLTVTFEAIENDVEIVDGVAEVTVVDDEIAEIGLVADDCEVVESEGGEVCIELIRGSLARPVVFRLFTRQDSALDGPDYDGRDGRPVIVTFPVGSRAGDRVCVNLNINDDDVAEFAESFTVHIEHFDINVFIPEGRMYKRITILDDDEPDLCFIDDTPQVCNDTVYFNFTSELPWESVACTIQERDLGTVPIDCDDGTGHFDSLTITRRAFTLSIHANFSDGRRAYLSRRFRSELLGECWFNLINKGITTSDAGITTVEWQGTGPSSDNRVDSFTCRVDRGTTGNCTSPYTINGLAPGGHTIRITPVDNGDCIQRFLNLDSDFTVEE